MLYDKDNPVFGSWFSEVFPNGPADIMSSLVKVMACRRTRDKPEPMMT